MHAQLAKWLTEKYDTRKPFFLFLNYVEAHQQYRPPRGILRYTSTEIWDRWQEKNQIQLSYEYMLTGTDVLLSEDIAEMESLYDDEIRYIDRKVGEVMEYFKSHRPRREYAGDHHRRPRGTFRRTSPVESRLLALRAAWCACR